MLPFRSGKADFWLVLTAKAAELSLLVLLLRSLPSAPPNSCWCLSVATNETEPCPIQSQSSEIYVFCPFAFYRILLHLLCFSGVVSLGQSLMCLFLPVHNLHFLGLSFFQLSAGLGINLGAYYWQLESREFPEYKETLPELECANLHLSLLQAVFFIFSFRRSYHHVWKKYKIISD